MPGVHFRRSHLLFFFFFKWTLIYLLLQRSRGEQFKSLRKPPDSLCLGSHEGPVSQRRYVIIFERPDHIYADGCIGSPLLFGDRYKCKSFSTRTLISITRDLLGPSESLTQPSFAPSLDTSKLLHCIFLPNGRNVDEYYAGKAHMMRQHHIYKYIYIYVYERMCERE